MDVRVSVETYTDVPFRQDKVRKIKCYYSFTYFVYPHATHLWIGYQMAKDFAENPLFEEKVERSERDGQDAEQNVRQGQIGDEAICDRLHGPVLGDDKDDEDVAQQADDEDDDVEDVNVHLHRRTAFQVVFFSQSPISEIIVQVVIEGRRHTAGR